MPLRILALSLTCLLPFYGVAQEPMTLPSALAQAFANRAIVRSARLGVAESEAIRRSLISFRGPSVAVGYSSREEVGGTDGDLVFSQPVDVFGRSRAARDAGDARVLRAQADLQASLVALQTEVVEQFSEAAAAASLATVSESTLKIVEDIEASVRSRVEGGVTPGVQATRFSIELERARATHRSRVSRRDALLVRLASLIGLSNSGLVLKPLSNLTVAPAVDLESERPDLLLMAADVASAQAELGQIRAASRPELEVQARRSPWQDSGGQFGVRLQLSWSIGNMERARYDRKAASERLAASRLALTDAQAIATGEVDAARVEVEAASQEAASLEKIVQSARLLVERTRTGLSEGASTLLEVLDALRALRETEEGLIEGRLQLALAQGRLLKATGQLLVKP